MKNKKWKAWYDNNREKFNELVKKHSRKRRTEMRKIIDERKKGPCVICGKTFDPVAMDFHHRDGEEKKFRISAAGKKIYDLKKLEEELDKCDLYCAVCRLIIDRHRFLNEEPTGSSGKRRKQLRDMVNSLKGEQCSSCGGIFPHYVIELDHLGELPKEVAVSKLVSDRNGKDRIIKEVEKCEPLCIICHRIRTKDRKLLAKINEWIEENVDKEREYTSKETNPCFFYSAAIAALFPGFKLIQGRQEPPLKGDNAHFWIEDKSGNIIDPTEYRNPNAKRVDGKEVSLKDNLNYVINDELFDDLSIEDQNKIIDIIPEANKENFV